jgi:hypothetical protein
MLGTVLPRHLIFTPAEVDAVGLPLPVRIGVVPRTLALGTIAAVVGAASSLLAAVVAAPLTTASVIVPFTVTTATASVLSPLQDHVRKMFHIATLSWRAAIVSIVQFVVAVVSLVLLVHSGIPLPWVPFGGLTIANLVSLSAGWIMAQRPRKAADEHPTLSMRDLAIRGRWLVLQAAAPSLAGFVVAAVVTRLASAEALGFAEAARVVSQPILVLAAGLTAVLAPRSVEAAMRRDRAMAAHTSRVYLATIGLAGGVYLAIAGWPWALNPMTRIVPAAYQVGGLVALTIVANVATASIFLQVNELLGARRERTLARLSWSTAPILVAGALTAGVTDAFARAIGRLGEAVTRLVVQSRALRSQYDPVVDEDAGQPVAGPAAAVE